MVNMQNRYEGISEKVGSSESVTASQVTILSRLADETEQEVANEYVVVEVPAAHADSVVTQGNQGPVGEEHQAVPPHVGPLKEVSYAELGHIFLVVVGGGGIVGAFAFRRKQFFGYFHLRFMEGALAMLE